MAYQILRRAAYEAENAVLPLGVRRKADWAIVQLGVRGRTPSTKGTVGLPLPWRRSPVQGSHYYLWWLNVADSGLALNGRRAPHTEGAILVHSVRHHDETDSSPALGVVGDYEALDTGLLDPRFEDQIEVARVAEKGDLTFTVVEGMPGSGKTVALLFLARDLATRSGTRKVRYITYTERLKRSARELFDSLGPEIAQHITVHTINDVVKQLLKVEVVSSPYGEIETFVRDLERLNPAQVGGWRHYPLTLYTELRGQIAGRTFPATYQLPAHREEQMRRRGGKIDVERYANRRKLELREAELAVNLAEHFSLRYFLDQGPAAQALEKVSGKSADAWLAHSDAFVIDEVQDFTLLQIALIAEMAAARRAADPSRPLALTVAGDESQIVQPTGFKWGVTKDIIRNRLAVNPGETRFDSQRRSPPLPARLILNSWQFYSDLPKDLRPSAVQKPDAAPDDAAERGLVMLAPPPASFDEPAWRALLDELAARPGRALIDLTEKMAPAVEGEARQALGEVLFQAREIKGLERGTVLVHGLEQTWQQVRALIDAGKGDRLAQMEARRLIDQIRVALSRSTSRLILLEAPDASVFGVLDFAAEELAMSLTLVDLTEMLQGEQMTDAEMVFALQEEADDLADRGRLDEALHRNRRAAALAQHAASTDLLQGLRLQEGDLLMGRAERELAAGQIVRAQETHKEVECLLDAAGEAAQQGERAERRQALSQALLDAAHSELAVLLDAGERAVAAGRLREAVEAADGALHRALLQGASREAAPDSAGAPGDRTRRALDLAIRAHIANAEELAAAAQPDHALIAASLTKIAEYFSLLQDSASAALFFLLAKPHQAPPTQVGPSDADLAKVLGETTATLYLCDPGAGPAALKANLPAAPPARQALTAAFAHLARRLDEAFALVDNHVALYYEWAQVAAHLGRLGGYPALDERLWDLEERYWQAGAPSGSFGAFLAAYNGDPASASVIWEQLGDLGMAIESARDAGDFERAARLFKNAHRPMPGEFATALKVQRQAQQLLQGLRALRAAERRALAEELARLHGALTDEGSEE